MAKTNPAPAPAPAAAPYTVVARRYRPQQFADLIGQEHVANALTNALTTGRIAHAYLFTGARGMGKTSTARILAKALNCVKGPTATPCDECDICQAIMAGDDVDAVEIDAASNNGVADARDLRANVGFRPQRARFKVYIIDETHMLSKQAFDALLKTLEEPPAHVKFIFATTEVQKLPATILSRCQRFDFAAITSQKVFETLRHIAAREGVEADGEALKIVARRAGGSMRDAQTLLDQLLGSVSGRLTAAAVHEVLGSAGEETVVALASAILASDAKSAVEQIGAAAGQGVQLGELLDQLVGYWRELMLACVAGPPAADSSGTADSVRSHAAAVNLDTVLAGLDVLTTAKLRLRNSPLAQVVLEVAVVRLARLGEVLAVPALVQMLASGSAPAASKLAVAPPPVVKKNSPLAPEPSKPPADDFAGVWEKVLLAMPMRAERLRRATAAKTAPTSVAIRFAAGYAADYHEMADARSVEAVRQALARVAGGDWTVRVTQEVGKVAAPPESPPPPAPLGGRAKIMQRPLFVKAADALGATFITADDGFDPDAAAPVIPTRAADHED